MRVHLATKDKIRVGFMLVVLLVGVRGTVSYRSVEKLIETQRSVTHTQEVRERIHAVYDADAKNIRQRMEALQKLAAGDPREQANIAALSHLVERLLNRSNATMSPDERAAPMDSIRQSVRRMDAEEARFLALRRLEAEETARTTKFVIVLGVVLALALVSAAALIIDRDNRKRHLVEQRLQEANERLAILATLDGLTSLANQRVFQERLEEEFQRARRYQTTLSLLILDVDRFKQFNDSFGHPAGDAVLESIARVLQQEARASDIVARHGGEEFAVLMPDTDAEGALSMGERIRAAIEGHLWPYRLVTASLGATTITPEMTAPSELVAEADRALYVSKGGGRNVVTHAHRHLPPPPSLTPPLLRLSREP